MHCGSCAAIITSKVSKIEGVQTCEVNFATKNATIQFDDTTINANDIAKEVEKYGYTLMMPAANSTTTETSTSDTKQDTELQKTWEKVRISIPIVSISILIMIWMLGVEYGAWASNEVLAEFLHHLLPIFATVMLTVV